MSRRIPLIGRRFGKWKIIADAPSRRKPCGEAHTFSVAQCDCGWIGEVANSSLLAGISLGCVECGYKSPKNIKHGHRRINSPTYQTWCSMKQRCLNPKNPNWKWYGGSGIGICQQWQDSFQHFLDDVGERPDGLEIDRIDNKRGYEPGNTHWIHQALQKRNTRKNVILTVAGRTACIAELCEHFCVPYGRTYARLERGWPVEEAFLAP